MPVELRIVELWVQGIPRPQGSKRAFKLPNGSVSMVEASRGLGDWRGDVKRAALDSGEKMLEGPVGMTANFVFSRPKSHFRTGQYADRLKLDAPHHVTKAPDLSKLVRAIEDAMEKVLYANDSQIAVISTSKTFGEKPGVWIKLENL